MINIKLEMLIAIISISITIVVNLFAILRITWKIASIYGELNARIDKNNRDINALSKSLRTEIERNSETIEGNVSTAIWQLQARVHTLEDHLEKTTDYRPPTFQR